MVAVPLGRRAEREPIAISALNTRAKTATPAGGGASTAVAISSGIAKARAEARKLSNTSDERAAAQLSSRFTSTCYAHGAAGAGVRRAPAGLVAAWSPAVTRRRTGRFQAPFARVSSGDQGEVSVASCGRDPGGSARTDRPRQRTTALR
jgi:hypothetical protein